MPPWTHSCRWWAQLWISGKLWQWHLQNDSWHIWIYWIFMSLQFSCFPVYDFSACGFEVLLLVLYLCTSLVRHMFDFVMFYYRSQSVIKRDFQFMTYHNIINWKSLSFFIPNCIYSVNLLQVLCEWLTSLNIVTSKVRFSQTENWSVFMHCAEC